MDIYQGETLDGHMILTDDEDNLIETLQGISIKLMLRNAFNEYKVIKTLTEIKADGIIPFSFASAETKKLELSAIIELKVTETLSGKVRISKKKVLNVIENKIKDEI